MKKILAFLLFLVMVLGLGACAGPEEPSSQKEKSAVEGNTAAQGSTAEVTLISPDEPIPIFNAKNEKIGELEQAERIFPTDGGFVYAKWTDKRDEMEYYLYTVSTQESIKIGSVENWFIQSDESVFLQNHLFFYVVTATDDGNVLRLLDLDLENRTMSEVCSEAGGNYYIPMTGAGDRLFMAKAEENGTCIQEYNLSTKELHTLKSFSFDEAKEEGETVKDLYAEGDTLSVLLLVKKNTKEDTAEGIVTPSQLRVDVYDKDMHLLKSRDVSDVSEEDTERDQLVTSFVYSGNLLYYQNNSSAQFFGKVLDNSLAMLMYPDNTLRMAHEAAQVSETKLVYRPYDGENALYLFDMKTGEMKESSFFADDKAYEIQNVYRDTSGNVWIRMATRDPSTEVKLTRLYYVQKSDLDFS